MRRATAAAFGQTATRRPDAETEIVWRDGFPHRGVEARLAYEELKGLERKRSRIVPEDIIETARNRKSVLHRLFDWDDRIAAGRWRIVQARQVVSAVQFRLVTADDGEGQHECVRAFYNVVSRKGEVDRDQEDARFYVGLRSVTDDGDYTLQVVAHALTELRGWQQRYRRYKQLGEVMASIDRFLADWEAENGD